MHSNQNLNSDVKTETTISQRCPLAEGTEFERCVEYNYKGRITIFNAKHSSTVGIFKVNNATVTTF